VPITILIVDDNSIVRRSLRACIDRNTDWRVCGEAENGAIAIEKVKQLHPDVVILDLAMPVMNGLEAARVISSIAPETAMLMFTMHHCEELLKDARAAGITEVLSKHEGLADSLLTSIRGVVCKPAR
jgi:DNA-binding NarL/FixJ family response regulator